MKSEQGLSERFPPFMPAQVTKMFIFLADMHIKRVQMRSTKLSFFAKLDYWEWISYHSVCLLL